MPDVRELPAGATARAARALLELRPQYGGADELVRRIDEVQRPQGYRLAGSFDAGEEDAAGVAGFRVVEMLAWGRALYVDDLSTLPGRRGRGHAGALFDWLGEEAARLGCRELHLDSGVGPHRTDAHRFYFRRGMRIAAFHFQRETG
ncbi:MAG TPA: GNAT family N-acetyltransferase [Solirubrobacteraceae bacterium]|nr:GNAT family N-acetyltransferase [Solirubrobacteraceae bacterium]